MARPLGNAAQQAGVANWVPVSGPASSGGATGTGCACGVGRMASNRGVQSRLRVRGESSERAGDATGRGARAGAENNQRQATQASRRAHPSKHPGSYLFS